MDYKNSGVDIEAGYKSVELMKEHIKKTQRAEVLGGIGGFAGAFDLVIADAPCSGLGVIRKKPEIRYKSPEDIAALPAVQLRILRGAAGCVKRGGTLLYSTCPVLREENEGVTEAFLSEDSRFSLIGQRTIRPHEFETDGFYYAVLRRS